MDEEDETFIPMLLTQLGDVSRIEESIASDFRDSQKNYAVIIAYSQEHKESCLCLKVGKDFNIEDVLADCETARVKSKNKLSKELYYLIIDLTGFGNEHIPRIDYRVLSRLGRRIAEPDGKTPYTYLIISKKEHFDILSKLIGGRDDIEMGTSYPTPIRT